MSLLLSALCFVYSLRGEAQSEYVENVRAYLDQANFSIPEGGQLAIAIVENDSSFTMGFHKINGELIAVENDTVLFEIGSVTKVMTALLLSDITENQSIDLNEEIGGYLPESLRMTRQAEYLNTIRLEHLASHYSGLPRDPLKAREYVRESTNPWSLYDLEELRYDLENCKLRNVGSKYRYSNVGFALLGLILEEIQGDGYENLVGSRILQPARMQHTFTSGNQNDSKAAIVGFDEKGKPADNWAFNLAAPAGGLVSCSADMANFLLWNMDADNEIAIACQKPLGKGQINGTLFSYVGLGWNIIETGLFKRYGYDDELVWHSGATAGFQSYVGLLKMNKVGVVVLTNFRSKKRHSAELGEYLLGRLVRF